MAKRRENTVNFVEEMTVPEERMITMLEELGLKVNTVNGRIRSVRGLNQFLHRENHLPRDKALGMEGVSKSEVSRLCQDLDETVQGFRERRLERTYPYVWLNATFPKVREGGHVLGMALVKTIFA